VRHPSRIGQLFPSLSDFAGTKDSLSWDGDPAPARHELLREMRSLFVSDVKAVGRRVVPKSLISQLQTYRNLGRRERSAYVRTRFSRGLGLRKNTERRVPPAAHSFLFLCHGNIMRSPMSERLLKQHFENAGANGMVVASAGLHATPGRSADPRARRVSPEFGISLEDHRAQSVTKELVKQFDVFFIMDFKNEVDFLARFPEAEEKMFFLSAYSTDPAYRSKEIPDPYFGDDDEVRRCYATLKDCIREVAQQFSAAMEHSRERELTTDATTARS
jgi:protein-tyrosine-phosphatase